MNQKIFNIIIGSLIVLIIIIGGIWFFLSFSGSNSGGIQQVVQNLFPFGTANDIQPGTAPGFSSGTTTFVGTQGEGSLTKITTTLRQLTGDPVSGAGFAMLGTSTTASSSPKVFFVEKTTGHIIETDPDTGIKKTITNTTLPQVRDSVFSPDGKSVVLRYLRDDEVTMESYLISIPQMAFEDVAERPLKGSFLPVNISGLFFSRAGDKLWFLTKGTSGSTITEKNITKGTESRVFSSPFSEWLFEITNSEAVFLSPKPSYAVKGYLFGGASQNNNLTKLLEGMGLTSKISPSGSFSLVGTVVGGTPDLSLFYLKTGEVTNLGIKTLPEKCVWDPKEKFALCAVPKDIPAAKTGYPDDWYRGGVSFSDNFYIVNTEPTSTTPLSPLNYAAQKEVSLDITSPVINQDGTHLLFVDKKTSTPWLLYITPLIENVGD